MDIAFNNYYYLIPINNAYLNSNDSIPIDCYHVFINNYLIRLFKLRIKYNICVRLPYELTDTGVS